jgi:hypothetical protein
MTSLIVSVFLFKIDSVLLESRSSMGISWLRESLIGIAKWILIYTIIQITTIFGFLVMFVLSGLSGFVSSSSNGIPPAIFFVPSMILIILGIPFSQLMDEYICPFLSVVSLLSIGCMIYSMIISFNWLSTCLSSPLVVCSFMDTELIFIMIGFEISTLITNILTLLASIRYAQAIEEEILYKVISNEVYSKAEEEAQ